MRFQGEHGVKWENSRGCARNLREHGGEKGQFKGMWKNLREHGVKCDTDNLL